MAVARPLRVVRALRAHEHRTAAALLALLVLAYLWPVLLGGNALAPTSLLYEWGPWASGAPAGIDSSINPQLADAVFLYYPWDVLARHLLHAGTFPAWNPYALAGTPFFGNFQVAWASPFSLPLWLLPLSYGLGLVAAIKLWLAGFGTYMLVRELGLGFWPAMLAAVGFALCAFNVVWLAHGVFVSVAAMLPWGLWLAERLVQRGRAGDGLALVVVAAIIQTGGHPGTQLHVVTAIVVYALVRTVASAEARRSNRVRRLGVVIAALTVGSLLSAVVLLPSQETSRETVGVWAREHHSNSFPGARMPLGVLRSALFPDWWGRPEGTELPTAPANFRERTLYAGTIPLVLALLALVTPGAWRRKAPFVLLAAVGVGVAVHSPIQSAVMQLPVFAGVQNQRMLLWFVFTIPVLGAFGLQSVMRRPRQRRVWAVVGVALLAALVALLSADLGDTSLGDVLAEFLHRSGASDAGTLALGSIAWWTIFVLALAGTLAFARRRPRVAALMVLVVALDLLHFAHGYQKMIPASSVVPPPTPAIAFLQRHASERRIVGLGDTLPDDFGIVYGLRDVRGRDVPQPSLRFDALWAAMSPKDNFGTISELTPASLKVLGILGARYLLTPPDASLAAHGVVLAYSGEDAAVYANDFALPRAMVARDVRAAGDVRQETAAVVASSFDARRDAVVRADEARGEMPLPGASGTARVTSERNARVTIQANLSRRGLVLLDDAYAPGWSVTVDGRPARPLETDVVLRGVVVPSGHHTVVWDYAVPGLRTGAALSTLGLLITLTWGAWLVLRRRTGRRARD